METSWHLLVHILRSLPSSVLPISPVGVLFWLVMGLVWFQYRRLAVLEHQIHGFVKNNPIRQSITAMLFGVIAGVIGSLFLVLPGITVAHQDILYLWPIALGLLLLSPRYLCFSYAGGIVAIAHLATGWPAGINVPSIMALVAVLHLMEGVLVMLSGRNAASPVYLKHGASGQVIGAYLIQRFWPIPIMLILIMQIPEELLGTTFPMPEWWPLISASVGQEGNWARILTPVVAALGYSDIAIGVEPKRRAYHSGLYLILFSLLLFLSAVLATRAMFWMWIAALFAPVGHELMIRISSAREFRSVPKFVASPRGVRLLDIQPGSEAQRLGLAAEDLILSVNETLVLTRTDLEFELQRAESDVRLRVEDGSGNERRLETDRLGGQARLGIITVPQAGDRPHVDLGTSGLIIRALQKIKRWWRQD